MERTVLITGAGSGIGRAAALEAARLGFGVVAAVHRAEQVDAVERAARDRGVRLDVEVLDVIDDDRAREVVERRRPWALVNNAGVMLPGPIADTTPEDARRHLDVMVLAPMRLVQLALPGMRAQGGGRVVNVSSIAGDVTGPLLGWYEAAKQALSTASDALRPELARDGIDVVVVEPGPYDTPIWDKAREHVRRRRAGAAEPAVYDDALGLLDGMARGAGDAEDVAEVIGKVLHAGRPRFRYRVGRGATALTTVAQLVPTSVRDRITRAAVGV